MRNRLKNETSPYLMQHSDNPVDWYPWCDEAFERAKKENKPIFLSIGYSTCHWCHVMAHESFEDKQIAEILNRHFISVKVDREERPDIDAVYMAVCQAFTGRGGWPMSIFMTWDKKPFFAGTYFPPRPQYGMPGFSTLLKTVAAGWEQNKQELLYSADNIVNAFKNAGRANQNAEDADLPQKAARMLADSFDSLYGGFGEAPKFPSPHNLLFLMLYAKQNSREDLLKMAEKTLMQMRLGGIFDHIGYGFSRYSTDRYYLVPHFEKMLYDNAWLIIAYSAAFSITGNSIYLDTAEKTAEYVLREMTSEDGGFFSAQDADSEGKEGRFYTFSFEEVINVLGDEKGSTFADIYDITPKGNFEGLNIPNLLKSKNLAANTDEAREKLYGYRKKRYHLHLDDKMLLSTGSMMTAAMAMLFRVTKNDRYLKNAQKAWEFAQKHLMDDLTLYTSCRGGKHSRQGFLDDYAYCVFALVELYNSTLDKEYLNKAEAVSAEAVRRFEDKENSGFYLSDTGSTELFINPKETFDGAIPSGNSMMAYNFVRLFQLTGKEEYRSLFLKQEKFMTSMALGNPLSSTMFLLAVLLYRIPTKQITVVFKDDGDILSAARNMPFLANVHIAEPDGEYKLLNGKTTYYVCEDHSCLPPCNELV